MTTSQLIRLCIETSAIKYIATPTEPNTPKNIYCVAGQVCYSLHEALEASLSHHYRTQKEKRNEYE